MRYSRLLAALLALALICQTTAHAGEKKLIEFGWDEPDTAFMRKHVAEMEALPFDGCVFHLNYLKDGAAKGPFSSENWGRRAFSEADLQPALDDLQATSFHRFTENLLRLNVLPGDVDWFDDFGPVLQNATLAAKIARRGHCRGILFDVEQYGSPLFNYPKQRDAKTKSFQEYSQQARRRGREVMQAFQSGYPGLTIVFTWGLSLAYIETGGKVSKLPETDYGLLPAFLNGMVDAASPDISLVDGYEGAYGSRDLKRFEAARKIFSTLALPFVDHPDTYKQRFTLGYGIWLDDSWRKYGWNPTEPAKNYFTPEQFRRSVQLALQQSDRYVWIYTEQPKWWSEQGKPLNLSPAYIQALRDARSDEPASTVHDCRLQPDRQPPTLGPCSLGVANPQEGPA